MSKPTLEQMRAACEAAANREPFDLDALRAASATLGVIAEAPDLFRAMVQMHRSTPALAEAFALFPGAQFKEVRSR